MANNRIFFAIQQVGFATPGSNSYTVGHGVQSIGITTTFNLEQVFELGQLAIYQNIENIPDVEVTMEKVLDGSPPLVTLITQAAPTRTLAGRSNQKCSVALSIFSDSQDASSGTPLTSVQMSGMNLASFGYTFPIDGSFAENVSLIGNDKVWLAGSGANFTGAFSTVDAPVGVGLVNRRQHMIFTPTVSTLDANSQVADPDCTILPRDVAGISASGTNNTDANGKFGAKVQSINVNCDLGRTELFEMGNKVPYTRFVNFPVEVTCSIEIIALSGDMIACTTLGINPDGSNASDQSIRIAIKEGLRLDLGTKNRLTNVSYGGGDTGGGNATVTYNYRNFNNCDVGHSGDVTVSLRTT